MYSKAMAVSLLSVYNKFIYMAISRVLFSFDESTAYFIQLFLYDLSNIYAEIVFTNARVQCKMYQIFVIVYDFQNNASVFRMYSHSRTF